MHAYIETLLFCATEPITAPEIQQCLEELLATEVPLEGIESALLALEQKYDNDQHAFKVYRRGGGYQFLTKPEYHHVLGTYLKQTTKKQLSKAALETLAVIAYRQPTTKSEIEQIRGVSSDYAVQKLLEKGLIIITGKAETVGQPLLYGTSDKFMSYFGINHLSELPQPKDFALPALETTQEQELE
jgi:segregation and condensation protein B